MCLTPSLLNCSHQYTICYLFSDLEDKNTYFHLSNNYCLISLFFIAKCFEWYILAISDSALLFLLEFLPIRNPSHYIKIDLAKFTNGFYVVKANQLLVSILLDLSVSFGIILSFSSWKVFPYLISKTLTLTWLSLHFPGYHLCVCFLSSSSSS